MKKVIAFKNTEEETIKSSSGGAFIALCKAFEDKYGIDNVRFFGANLQKDMTTRHTMAITAEQCRKFQGSKYVRSEIGKIYEKVIAELNTGKWVLFSGTPCQVASLKQYVITRLYTLDRLFTIDVICHGAPKKNVWDKYKGWLEKRENSKLIDYSFRYKPEGWKAYPAYAKFANGKTLINTPETSVYSKLHLNGYSMPKGCFSCPFACESRESDITLGDFWGIERITTHIPYRTGVSLVLCNTKVGEEIVKLLDQGYVETYYYQINDKRYLDEQHNLKAPTEQPALYDSFWDDFSKIPFEEVAIKYAGFGKKYKLKHIIKKIVRKTPLIEAYRYLKR